ncbi:MAG: glycosyltransferase [Thiotrichales bacterium]
MSHAKLIVAAVVAVLTFMLWALLNRPADEAPWPTQIKGFSFSPMHLEHHPGEGRFPTVEQIDADLALLAGKVKAVRTYTVEDTLADVPRLAKAHDIDVALGAWIDGRLERNEAEIERVIELSRGDWRTVRRIFVGNEVLLHDLVPLPQLIEYLDRVRAVVPAVVSVAEPWHIWLKHPELVDHVDFIAVHLLPYWEGLPIDQAVDYVAMRYAELEKAFPGKPIVIAEVGWPSNGRLFRAAEASVANQALFLRRFLHLAQQQKWEYFVMEAFDQPWKESVEGAVGAYWGAYDVKREPKFPFISPIVSVPHWRELAAVSVLVAILLLIPLFRDSPELNSRGLGFLALVTYGATTVAVWMVYDYLQQYLTWGTILLGLIMLLAVFGLILVLLAEAHEWAEALWLRRSRRPFRRDPLPDGVLPLVSIHVPAYNEPPEMLGETLEALSRLDYPRFEVLVIDNNTRDPAVWEPVEALCERLGERFRFFHVDPLAGFKAGALNFALRHTAADAEIVAVIDSDYIVEPTWLRDLVPAFGDPKLAIVQSPQDYRDGEENAFKAMCMAEYRGFFQIGMITRNERNAIIQHGTMTLVRRKVLDEVGGWGEWCITEDAELGLRVFEHGYEAAYLPRSYGRGLIPDTFIDFKKQRFRWAYGAVLILRKHLGALFGTRPTQLTPGQRYHFIAGWLPWFADGINLFFNIAALAWTVAMVVAPDYIDPPLMIFAFFPLALFVFKLLKMSLLYRQRVGASWRQSAGAAVAGLALSHTIARAMITGFITRGVGFFRTPKMASTSALGRAFADAREEVLMMIALWLGAWGALHVQGRDMLDVKVWALMLFVQSLPYLAAVIMALVSALPRLPARWVGAFAHLDDRSRLGGSGPS